MTIAKLIKVNTETVPELGKGYGMKILGDFFHQNYHYWDLEFPNLAQASSFAETVKYSDDVVDIDIRDSVCSLYQTVVLTLQASY
jgi:hypothetical protein